MRTEYSDYKRCRFPVGTRSIARAWRLPSPARPVELTSSATVGTDGIIGGDSAEKVRLPDGCLERYMR